VVGEVGAACKASLGGIYPLWPGGEHAPLPLPSPHVVSKSLRSQEGGGAYRTAVADRIIPETLRAPG